jgi:hypothetical protein
MVAIYLEVHLVDQMTVATLSIMTTCSDLKLVVSMVRLMVEQRVTSMVARSNARRLIGRFAPREIVTG